METINLIRFIAGTVLITLGIIVFLVEILGVFKLKYTLDRMHFAGCGDTLALACTILGAVIINGINFTSFKLLLVLVFFWFTSPVSSHLIARLVVATDERLEENCDIQTEAETCHSEPEG